MAPALLRTVILAFWIAWLAYWLSAARGAKATQWRESMGEQWAHGSLALAGTILLAAPRLLPLPRFLPVGVALPLLGAAVTAVGLELAIAARRQLAGNWSASVEIKENHALIRTGPYRYVRHPIYSGLLLAAFGTALALGRWQSLLGWALLLASLLLKSRREEARLRQTFPDYARYAQETAALIPFLL
ncbi:MAG TPA: isoprenylcysteine carboxylmethyltransferase family protein [Stellaceae bacterium]|nr:isoprenylcysteine carboxylmethyltransferase family protein [Stellaceae bacterium]